MWGLILEPSKAGDGSDDQETPHQASGTQMLAQEEGCDEDRRHWFGERRYNRSRAGCASQPGKHEGVRSHHAGREEPDQAPRLGRSGQRDLADLGNQEVARDEHQGSDVHDPGCDREGVHSSRQGRADVSGEREACARAQRCHHTQSRILGVLTAAADNADQE